MSIKVQGQSGNNWHQNDINPGAWQSLYNGDVYDVYDPEKQWTETIDSTVHDVYVRQRELWSYSWKKARQAYVRKDGQWMLAHNTPIVVYMTPDKIY